MTTKPEVRDGGFSVSSDETATGLDAKRASAAACDELHIGDYVWTARLEWCYSYGYAVRDRWGSYSGYVGSPRELMIRHARHAYRCTDCGDRIDKDEMHGSTYYDHYCLNCIRVKAPESQFRPAANGST